MPERAPEEFEHYARDETHRKSGGTMQERYIVVLKQSDVTHQDGQCVLEMKRAIVFAPALPQIHQQIILRASSSGKLFAEW
jgi:hypothetical protein